LKVLLVNLLAALIFANVFFKNKKAFGKLRKTLKTVKNVTKIKKSKNVLHLYGCRSSLRNRLKTYLFRRFYETV